MRWPCSCNVRITSAMPAKIGTSAMRAVMIFRPRINNDGAWYKGTLTSLITFRIGIRRMRATSSGVCAPCQPVSSRKIPITSIKLSAIVPSKSKMIVSFSVIFLWVKQGGKNLPGHCRFRHYTNNHEYAFAVQVIHPFALSFVLQIKVCRQCYEYDRHAAVQPIYKARQMRCPIQVSGKCIEQQHKSR